MAYVVSISDVPISNDLLRGVVQNLLLLAGIPNEPVTRGDNKHNLGKIDLVIPDSRTAVQDPDKAHFLIVEAQVGEEWAQVSREDLPDHNVHLVTLQADLDYDVAQQIIDHGIFLYVLDRIKADRFPDEPRIRMLSDLPHKVI